MIGNYQQLLSKLFVGFVNAIAINAYLTVFGVISFLICIMIFPFFTQIKTIMLPSLFMVLIGIWNACNYHLESLVMDIELAAVLEQTCFFLAQGILFLIIDSIYGFSLRGSRIIKSLAILTIPLTICSIILDQAGIISMVYWHPIFYGLSVIAATFLIYILVVQIINRTCSQTQFINLITLTFFICCIYAHTIVSNYLSGTEIGNNKLLNEAFSYGAVVYIAGQMINYLTFSTYYTEFHKTNESLTHLAYTDALTGLKNRAALSNIILALNKDAQDFCLISLDLNGLKEINDSKGHDAGDRLLKEFAEVLNHIFGEIGDIIRIGGDEFIIILKNITSDTVDDCIMRMNVSLSNLDAKEPEINHTAAYGYAFRSECTGIIKDFHNTYMLADDKMYKCKEKQHKAIHKKSG